MAVPQRADVPVGVPVRRETVPIPSLGFDVIVRGRMLAESMLLRSIMDEDALPEGEELTKRQAKEREVRRGAQIICETLHLQVVLEDGEPMWTPDQWSQHGAAQPGELLDLYKVAQRLSGAVTEDLAKN